jgi:hypothetical protein
VRSGRGQSRRARSSQTTGPSIATAGACAYHYTPHVLADVAPQETRQRSSGGIKATRHSAPAPRPCRASAIGCRMALMPTGVSMCRLRGLRLRPDSYQQRRSVRGSVPSHVRSRLLVQLENCRPGVLQVECKLFRRCKVSADMPGFLQICIRLHGPSTAYPGWLVFNENACGC